MKFTGERFIPSDSYLQIALEHWHRYLLASEFCKDKIVLDMASGEGFGSNHLAQSARFVIGADISKEAVDHGKEKYTKSNLKFIQASIENIPLKTNSIDVIISFETIEHVYERLQKSFLNEIKRILKDDGLLIISTPDKYFYSDITNYKNEFHIKEFYMEEFSSFLSQYFKYSTFGFQKIFLNSLINENNSNILTRYMTIKSGNEFIGIPGNYSNEYLYIIALCSNKHPVELHSSINLDINNTLINELSCRSEILNNHNIKLSEDNIKLSEDIRKNKEELENKEKDFNDKFKKINEELNKKNMIIENQKADIDRLIEKEHILHEIYTSHGWKALIKYYKIRDFLLPLNSARRQIVQSIFRFFIKNDKEPHGKRTPEKKIDDKPLHREDYNVKIATGIIIYKSELDVLVKNIKMFFRQSIFNEHSNFDLRIIILDNNEGNQLEELKDILKTNLNDDFYNKIIYIPSENSGFGAGHNKIFNYAKGLFDFDYYLCVNPDGIPKENMLKELVGFAQKKYNRGLFEARQFPIEHPKVYDPLSGITEWISGCCVMFPRIIYEELNGFDDFFFMYMEDVDLSWRARLAGYECYTVPLAYFNHFFDEHDRDMKGLRKNMFISGYKLAGKYKNERFKRFVLEELINMMSSQELKELEKLVLSKSSSYINFKTEDFMNFSSGFSFSQVRWG